MERRHKIAKKQVKNSKNCCPVLSEKVGKKWAFCNFLERFFVDGQKMCKMPKKSGQLPTFCPLLKNPKPLVVERFLTPSAQKPTFFP